MTLDIRGGLKNTPINKNHYVVFEEILSNAIEEKISRRGCLKCAFSSIGCSQEVLDNCRWYTFLTALLQRRRNNPVRPGSGSSMIFGLDMLFKSYEQDVRVRHRNVQ